MGGRRRGKCGEYFGREELKRARLTKVEVNFWIRKISVEKECAFGVLCQLSREVIKSRSS